MNILGDISTETFLSEYWQKKPLLIRNAFPDFEPPVDPDDIAGLSLDEDVESRILIEDVDKQSWQVRHGPFSEQSFTELPKENWTLLVQAVDHWIPEFADLLGQFSFIPSWRRDDLMVSFAPKGGSVGPHYDLYDVFLVQGMGQRHWQLGPKCDDNTKTLPDLPVKILESMNVEHEWTLNPGDMLYIPPSYAHNGVAVNDCMTFSIGFRAPSEADVLQGFTDHLAAELNNDQRYTDPALKSAEDSPAFIDDDAIERFRQILQQNISQESQLKKWLAQTMTEPKYEELHQPLEEELEWEDIESLFKEATLLTQNETSRWAYFKDEQQVCLFINGQPQAMAESKTTQELAQYLANARHVNIEDITSYLTEPDCQNLLLDLINGNYLYFEG